MIDPPGNCPGCLQGACSAPTSETVIRLCIRRFNFAHLRIDSPLCRLASRSHVGKGSVGCARNDEGGFLWIAHQEVATGKLWHASALRRKTSASMTTPCLRKHHAGRNFSSAMAEWVFQTSRTMPGISFFKMSTYLPVNRKGLLMPQM